jgi:hypothetical protein
VLVLQSKALELQQRLALALSADRKKDVMIEQLDKVWTHLTLIYTLALSLFLSLSSSLPHTCTSLGSTVPVKSLDTPALSRIFLYLYYFLHCRIILKTSKL